MKRLLSASESDFLAELEIFDKVLAFTCHVSLNQHGIKTDGRGMRAMKIFTRQTLTGFSLQKLFPRPNPEKDRDSDLWDIGSLASLSRNLMEGYISLDYFGLEMISETEADLRFQLLQLHRNIEWCNIRSKDLNDEERHQFQLGIPLQKEKIRTHPFFNNLSDHRKKQALQWREMYKSKGEFEKENKFCEDFVEHYRLLSNLVHPLPLSIEPIDNDRGRGLGTENDIAYCLNCLMLARRYLAVSTVGIVDHFPVELANKFRVPLDEVRPLQSKGFEATS